MKYLSKVGLNECLFTVIYWPVFNVSTFVLRYAGCFFKTAQQEAKHKNKKPIITVKS